MKQIQRSLIITHGQLAHLVGQVLQTRFELPLQPKLAVNILPIEVLQGEIDLTEDENLPFSSTLSSCYSVLHQLTQRSHQHLLAQTGWVLDRLNEVAVFFIFDGKESSIQPIISTLTELMEIAETDFALNLFSLLVNVGCISHLDELTDSSSQFPRGVLSLEMVNEENLSLSNEEELTEMMSNILHALVTTPLRSTPEWLAESSGWRENGLWFTAGISSWQWDPILLQNQLAYQWAIKQLCQWQQESLTSETNTTATETWWQLQNMDYSVLSETYNQNHLSAPFPNWHLTQPYRLHNSLSQLLHQFPTQSSDLAIEFLCPQFARVKDHLYIYCQKLLNQFASPIFVRDFLKNVKDLLTNLQDQLAGWQIQEEKIVHAGTYYTDTLQDQIKAKLAKYPKPTVESWLKAITLPHKMLRTAYIYWQLQKLGQQLTHHLNRVYELEQQRAFTIAYADMLLELEQWIHHLDEQVEELQQMLLFLHGSLTTELEEMPASSIDINSCHFFLDNPANLPTIPLGNQLINLDDKTVKEELIQAGKALYQFLHDLTATDILLNTTNIQTWWQTQFSNSAPQYRPHPTTQRSKATITILCSPKIDLLRSNLPTDVQLLSHNNPNEIIVMRLSLLSGQVVGT